MRSVRKKLGILALMVDVVLLPNGCVIDISDIEVDGDDWSSSQKVEVTSAYSRVIPVQGRTGLVLVGANGDVLIHGVEGASEVVVEAVRRVRSHTRRDAEEHLDLLQIQVAVGSDEIEVKTWQPSHTGGRGYVVDYDLQVPVDFRVQVTNGNGEVRIWDLRGNARVDAGNGDVVLSGHRGNAWISVGNGEIRSAIDLPHQGEIVQAVGNGAIQLTLQPQASAAFGARVGNGTISVSGLSFTEWVSTPHAAEGVLGDGDGFIDLSVGNGWIKVKGG